MSGAINIMMGNDYVSNVSANVTPLETEIIHYTNNVFSSNGLLITMVVITFVVVVLVALIMFTRRTHRQKTLKLGTKK